MEVVYLHEDFYEPLETCWLRQTRKGRKKQGCPDQKKEMLMEKATHWFKEGEACHVQEVQGAHAEGGNGPA